MEARYEVLNTIRDTCATKAIDKPPEEAQRLKDFMRMRDDYFLEVPEDLKPKEMETKLAGLKSLCRSICEKSED